MYSPDELHGLNAMVPAFAKEGATSLEAVDTVDVDKLTDAVNRMIEAGANVISTTGSYGECYSLLDDEYQVLVRATLEAVRDRVPVFIGVTHQNPREEVRRARFAREAGAQGIFVGVSHYYVPTVDNAIAHYREMSELFSDLSIQLYHNPTLHRIHIPVDAFNEISKNRNIVSMKDSHRTASEFMLLQRIIRDKISVFVNQTQYYPYAEWGARGFWSTACFMGPSPLLYWRDVVDAGEYDKAEEVLYDLTGGRVGAGEDVVGPADNARKLGATYAGWADQGPNRPPYFVVKPESMQRAIKSAERWKGLEEKYAPLLAARAKIGIPN